MCVLIQHYFKVIIAVAFREKLLVKVLAHLPIVERRDEKKLARRARHRYERPSAVQAGMNRKHNHPHVPSTTSSADESYHPKFFSVSRRCAGIKINTLQ